jgi:hypothetical protein
MLKTVLKVLAFYVILSALVSGCSLIGEYAEGMSGAASNAKGSISSESESKKADKPDTEQGKRESATIKITIDGTLKEETYIELSIVPERERKEARGEADLTLYVALPGDLVRMALDEIHRRKRYVFFEKIPKTVLFV